MHRIPFNVRLGVFPGPSIQHNPLQRSPLISSGIPQHPPQLTSAGYPACAQQQGPVGSLCERHLELWTVDNRQHPSRRSVEQQYVPGCPIQYQQQQPQPQPQPQPHRPGTGAQQTHATMSQLSLPGCGHLPTYVAPSPIHHAHAHPPTQSPSLYTIHSPTASPQWASGGSSHGQEQYHYIPRPTLHPHPAQPQAHQWQPYPSPALTPAEDFHLVHDPLSHFQTYLPQANKTPNSGTGPGGSGVYMDGVSTSGEPMSFSQRTGPNSSDRISEGQVPKPSKRPTPAAARKTRPVGYEGNLELLRQRCRRQGADEDAIRLLGNVFTDGVNLAALTRPLTGREVETEDVEMRAGKAYTIFLGSTNEGEGVPPRFVCRLCHGDQTWKHSKDVLRHLRRDHFGLADTCERCDEKYYTTSEKTRHPCKQIERTWLASST